MEIWRLVMLQQTLHIIFIGKPFSGTSCLLRSRGFSFHCHLPVESSFLISSSNPPSNTLCLQLSSGHFTSFQPESYFSNVQRTCEKEDIKNFQLRSCLWRVPCLIATGVMCPRVLIFNWLEPKGGHFKNDQQHSRWHNRWLWHGTSEIMAFIIFFHLESGLLENWKLKNA